MNLHNLFEDDSRTPNPNYAEELAYQIFKAAPDLDTTGAADEVLDYAYDLVVNDFGKTKANALFAYDEDFDSDLVTAYLDLQMNSKAEEEKQINEFDMPVGQGTGTAAQTDTPPNRSFGVMIKGKLPPGPGGATAEDIWETLELILPRDYPRIPFQQQSGNNPQRRVLDDLRADGFSIVKQGINSEDIAATIASKFKKYRIPAEVIDGGLYEAYDPAQASKFISAATKAAKIIFLHKKTWSQTFNQELELQYGFTDPTGAYTTYSDHDAKKLISWLESKGCKLSYDPKEPIEFSLSMPDQAQPYTFNILDMIQGGELNENWANRKVDKNGRTQQEWMQAVSKAYPDARIVQAKMIDGPCYALLADGRKITWTADHTMTEARAASASFRAGNKKRAELNAMSDEERRAYDKEQQEKQRKRDDARLEKDRQKNAAKKKSVEEGTVYDLEKEYGYEKPASKPRRSSPSDYPYSPEEDDAYFREIFRKKREAAKKAAQDKGSDVAEGSVVKTATGLKHTSTDKYGAGEEPFHPRNPGKYARDLDHVNKQFVKDLDASMGITWKNKGTNGVEVDENYSDEEHPIQSDTGVEAYGYAYNNRDQRVAWRKEFSSQEAAYKWADSKNATVMGVRPAQQAVSEVKKKDNTVKDVALQRAMSKARAANPAASSDFEALAKDMLKGQAQDQDEFEQIRKADRRQDELLSQINQIDQTQTQEINDLEQDNNTLQSRLRQMQAVNSNLEKTLANMTGRKTTKSNPVDSAPASASGGTAPAAQAKAKAKTKSKKSSAPDAIKATAKQLAAPADPMAAMTNRITKGDSSVIDKVSGQSALPFEPSDNVLEPVIPQAQANPRFAAARANASDADPRYYADLTSRIAKDAVADPEKALQTYRVHEGDKPEKAERPEADYGDEYQDMVKRVKHLAGQGPRKTVWDPVKRVYKTVPTNK